MNRWVFLIPVAKALAGMLVIGRPARGQDAPGNRAENPRPGLILLVEGIGGIHLMQVAGKIGFSQAGLPHQVRQFYWSHGPGQLLKDLQDSRHTLARSEELAGEILALKRNQPDLRIFLVGHSGGTGVIAQAAERLPPQSLERIVFLSSALSPHCDLRPALAASRGGIVSYHSPYDLFFLRLGTCQFGTIDRFYEPAAGYAGFQVPVDLAPEDRILYERLIQIPWSPPMILQGNWGNHVGTVQPCFLGGEVARWLW